MTVEYAMSILVEPCVMQEITTAEIGAMSYTIGDSGIVSDQYVFTQVPACAYPMPITVTGLPSFATHDATAQTFAIAKTEDLSLHGVYDVAIRAEVLQPTDHTKTEFLTLSRDYTFQIEMVDPCFASSFELFVISDIQYSVMLPQHSHSVAQVSDLASLKYGNLDGLTYCGLRVIELSTDPAAYSSFLSLDASSWQLHVQTDD